MTFLPLALTTQLGDAGADFFLGAGTDYTICTRAPLSSAPQYRGLHRVRAWVVLNGRGRPRLQWIAPFTTLSSVAVMFGLDADRSIRLPPLTWSLLRGPRTRETMLGPGQIAEMHRAVPSRRDVAIAHVTEVRELYGRMLSDVAYRIENAALFDSGVATTSRFEEALALWATVTNTTAEDEVIRRAGMVRLTFAAARAHAETVGLAHLPRSARADAGRAAKAARLARTSASSHERAAALEQMARILGRLALHYLPNPDDATRELTGPSAAGS